VYTYICIHIHCRYTCMLYLHVCIHTYVYICMYTCMLYLRTYVHIHTFEESYMYVYTHTCPYINMHIHVHMHVYVCVFVCVCVCVCVCVDKHTCITLNAAREMTRHVTYEAHVILVQNFKSQSPSTIAGSPHQRSRDIHRLCFYYLLL
jgi:hypothetical protein